MGAGWPLLPRWAKEKEASGSGRSIRWRRGRCREPRGRFIPSGPLTAEPSHSSLKGSSRRLKSPEGRLKILSDAPFPLGGTWNRDGVILFAPNYTDPLYRVLATGGEPTPVTTVDRAAKETHLWPHFLPDGRHFLYVRWHNPAMPLQRAIHIGSLDGKDKTPRFLLAAHSNVAYASPGYLLFERDRTLFAQPFDAEHLQVKR